MSGYRILLAAMLLSGVGAAFADDEVVEYVTYDDRLASGGAVTAAALERLRDAGLQQVVYLGHTDAESALAHEDRVVDALGMDFAQIPVNGKAPGAAEFRLFTGLMNQSADRRTLVHCGSNKRASAFVMLYRAIHAGVPVAEAKADMNAVWTPNETWTNFILGTLEGAGVDPYCEGCDWTPAEPQRK